MNVLKKYFPYVAIAILSSLFTVFLVNRANKANDQSFSSNDSESNAYFTSAKNVGFLGGDSDDFTQAAEKSINAVVSIKNYASGRSSNDNFFDFFYGFDSAPRENVPSGLGSGVIISQDGYIVTNNHVISGANKIEVTLNNQQTFVAELVGTDPSTDIALLKIDEDQLPFLNFSDSDNVEIGEWVLAVGNPFGLTSTVTAGIISAKSRSINILRENSENPIEAFIQTDAAVNPGNSGGALVNTNGDLVGINTAISSHSGSYEGYSFAVPSNIAKKIVEDLKKYGIPQRGYIGFVPLDLTDEKQVKLYNSEYGTNLKTQQGVMVYRLSDNGAAYDAGIKKGDIITAIDGKTIKNYASLTNAIGSKRPGDNVSVKVNRNGQTKTFNLQLKDEKGSTKLRSKDDLSVSEKLQVDFEPLTSRQKTNYGLDHGVWVTNITSQSPLKQAGIGEGFIILEINDKEVDNASDVEKILKKYKGNVSIKYVDYRGRIYTRGFDYK